METRQMKWDEAIGELLDLMGKQVTIRLDTPHRLGEEPRSPIAHFTGILGSGSDDSASAAVVGADRVLLQLEVAGQPLGGVAIEGFDYINASWMDDVLGYQHFVIQLERYVVRLEPSSVQPG